MMLNIQLSSKALSLFTWEKIVTMAPVAAQGTWISMAQGTKICFRWLLRIWASAKPLVVTVAKDITPDSSHCRAGPRYGPRHHPGPRCLRCPRWQQ